jgi:hypothetical protein
MVLAIASRGGSSTPQLWRDWMAVFECDAQETRGLWIEPLAIQVLSDWHQKSARLLVEMGRQGSRRGHPSGLARGAKSAEPPCLGSFMLQT